ncbi:ABC transporter permease [Actinomadura fibrosa]|uniref:ABC transporter permease n=1 Tax=Actinomadura fibrosa TaxID=111802 RepID=A0ABW2XWT0_9ACTN|nr:ABC transporter permease subunit [Actinomadura fibrosa]
MNPVARNGARLALVAALVLAWEAATRRAEEPFFPTPWQIATQLRRLWFSGPAARLWMTDDAVANLLPSLARLLGGFALASLAGLVLGLVVGRSSVGDFVEPALRFCRAIPPPALLPVFLAIFKVGTQMQIATIVFGVIWPVLINTAEGARGVDGQFMDTARVFRLTPAQRLFRIILPAAAPKVFAGLRLSLSLSLILMVISELVASTNGIGFKLLLETQRTFDLPAMWGGLVVLGVLGFLLNTLLLAVERRLLAWNRRDA